MAPGDPDPKVVTIVVGTGVKLKVVVRDKIPHDTIFIIDLHPSLIAERPRA